MAYTCKSSTQESDAGKLSLVSGPLGLYCAKENERGKKGWRGKEGEKEGGKFTKKNRIFISKHTTICIYVTLSMYICI